MPVTKGHSITKKDHTHALNADIFMFTLPILRDDKTQPSSSLGLFESIFLDCLPK